MTKNRRRAEKREIKNGCSGKKRYQDLEKAKQAAITLLERKTRKKYTTVYQCYKCNKYHVSSMKGRGWVVLCERTTDDETQTGPPLDQEGSTSRDQEESVDGRGSAAQESS